MPILPPDPTTHEAYDIVYEDLVNEIINKIKSICVNINSYSSSVRDNFKNGKTFTIASKSYTASGSRTAHTKTVTAKVQDDMCAVVPESKIREQFEQFLIDRGIAVTNKKGKEVISMKSMMNFYANVATFITSRIVFMTNVFKPENDDAPQTKLRFYNQGNVSYNTVSIGTDIDFTKANMESFAQDLMKAITKTTHAHAVKTTLSFTSCSSSSSSSSSSSCSSSCSSSSSSFFIAFMEV